MPQDLDPTQLEKLQELQKLMATIETKTPGAKSSEHALLKTPTMTGLALSVLGAVLIVVGALDGQPDIIPVGQRCSTLGSCSPEARRWATASPAALPSLGSHRNRSNELWRRGPMALFWTPCRTNAAHQTPGGESRRFPAPFSDTTAKENLMQKWITCALALARVRVMRFGPVQGLGDQPDSGRPRQRAQPAT